MIGLPKTTDFNKRIPKEKFYENLNVTPTVKKCFVEQIKVIYWRNKIAATTTNLAVGTTVNEIEVFEIKLKGSLLDESVLRQIDKEIPYHILFLLEYDGKYQAWTAYKEASAGNAAFKVNQYYHTDWVAEDESLQDAVERDEKVKNLKKQIEVLQARIRKEKQLNVQMKLNTELKKLKKELEVLQ